MKRFLKYAITIIVVMILVPMTANAQTIKRNQKPKTEQTQKNNKSKKNSKTLSKSTKTDKEKSNNSSSSKNNRGQKTVKEFNESGKRGIQAAKDKAAEATQRVADELSGPDIKTITVNGVTFDMIWVEGGTFMMGATKEIGDEASIDEKPVHKVTLTSFYISRYEVTQELWVAIMGHNPSKFQGDLNKPVEQVSWNDCQVFIRKLNSITGKRFRLPTEAEWEFAARGGNKSQGCRYAGCNAIYSIAWYCDNSYGNTHPVGVKAPNELGLYDMSGNVWEWCEDWYGDYHSSDQTNPTGPFSGTSRVGRGGSWFSFSEGCRVSIRNDIAPDASDDNLGLRLAANSF